MTPVDRWLPRMIKACAAAALAFCAVSPAQAQFFWISPDNSGAPVTGAEIDVGIPLPGANPVEQEAALIWTMRTGLNTAALQCQFEPMLMSVENYNGALENHEDEFVRAYQTVESYFKRTQGSKWLAQFDTYRTRLYNYFGTVSAQYTFCQTAGKIGQEALFAPRGSMAQLARSRMREFRNSLITRGDQLRVLYRPQWSPLVLPSFDDKCWDRKNRLKKDCLRAYQEAKAQPHALVYG